MENIKISELSIGDWVRMGGKNFQIYHLTLAGDVYGYRRTDNSFTGEEYYDGEIGDVQPIPLTPEILEKNGFEKKWGRWYNSETRMEFEQYKDGWSRTINGGEYSAYFIKYVHQLQRAMKLEGTEKEIIL